MLLDESVDRATRLGLELDAKKDALAIATKKLEESEKKRVAAESALNASQLKFSGTFLSKLFELPCCYSTPGLTLFFPLVLSCRGKIEGSQLGLV